VKKTYSYPHVTLKNYLILKATEILTGQHSDCLHCIFKGIRLACTPILPEECACEKSKQSEKHKKPIGWI